MTATPKNTAEIIPFPLFHYSAQEHVVTLSNEPESPTAAGFCEDQDKGDVTLTSTAISCLSHPGVTAPAQPTGALTANPKAQAGNVKKFKEIVASLTDAQLRKVYHKEFNSWRNMKQRVLVPGFVHPDFKSFRSFLLYMGPIPHEGWTLDRINNQDREYAPGKVRWAPPRVQNNNKSDNLAFQCSLTGKVYTAPALAKIQNVSEAAIRVRKNRGWSDDEIVAGVRASKPCAQNTKASSKSAKSEFADDELNGDPYGDGPSDQMRAGLGLPPKPKPEPKSKRITFSDPDAGYDSPEDRARMARYKRTRQALECAISLPWAKHSCWHVALDNLKGMRSISSLDWQAFVDCVSADCPGADWWDLNFPRLWELYKPYSRKIFSQLPEKVQFAIAQIDLEYPFCPGSPAAPCPQL